MLGEVTSIPLEKLWKTFLVALQKMVDLTKNENLTKNAKHFA